MQRSVWDGGARSRAAFPHRHRVLTIRHRSAGPERSVHATLAVTRGWGTAMELDLAEVYSFTVLVDHRHFGRAARQLHLSPSGLTKRIQRLERHLGVRLVERGPEGVVGVTTAGVRFADRARHLLVEARNTAIYAREATSTVVIGLPGALGPQSVAQWTGELSTRLRHLLSTRVHCIGVPFDDMATAVATGRVDILLSAVPSSEPAVVSTRLWPLVRVGVLARSHAVSGAPSIAVEDFAQLPMLRDAALPEKWMSLWWLGDVRPLAAARLVEIGARTQEDVLRRIGLGREGDRRPAHVHATAARGHLLRGPRRRAADVVLRRLPRARAAREHPPGGAGAACRQRPGASTDPDPPPIWPHTGFSPVPQRPDG